MDAQDLCSRHTLRIPALLAGDLCDIPEGSGQYLFGLCDSRGEDPGHPFSDDLFQPILQALLLRVVRIKTIRTVSVHINKAGNQTQITEIHVRHTGPIGADSLDPPGFRGDFDLGLQPVIQYPHPSALQDHVLFLPHLMRYNQVDSSQLSTGFEKNCTRPR